MARPGLGYILRPGFMLPPLMFTEEEIEALVLGSRWVAKRSDARLGLAARNALAKITAVLPEELRDDADNSSLLVGPGEPLSAGENELPAIRQAIRNERKIAITYRDDKMRETRRTIWPFALGYFDRVRIVAGLVRAAAFGPALPRRSDRRARRHRDALSAPAPRAAEGMARGRRHPRAIMPDGASRPRRYLDGPPLAVQDLQMFRAFPLFGLLLFPLAAEASCPSVPLELQVRSGNDDEPRD